jgi:hypothetical protein
MRAAAEADDMVQRAQLVAEMGWTVGSGAHTSLSLDNNFSHAWFTGTRDIAIDRLSLQPRQPSAAC